MLTNRGSGARVTIIVVLFGFSMTCVPSVQWLGVDSPFDAASNVSASPDDYEINIGISQMAISTLNPFAVVTFSEWLVIWPCYSTLLMNDFDGTGFIGDLATSWNVSSDGTLWHFHIFDGAYFYDDRETVQTHLVTAADVIFSYWIVQNYTSNHLHSLVTDLGDVPLPLIVDMWSDGPFEVYIQTSAPYAPFYRTLATVPIVPKYYWEGSDPTNFLNEMLIGSGPFYYDGYGLPHTNVCSLKRNPVWHQTEMRGWQIHTGTVNIKAFVDAEYGYAALVADPPQIDVLLDVSRDIYLDQIPAEDPSKKLVQFEANNGFVDYVILNQMTDEMREYLGGVCEYGTNNELLLDPIIKRAVAMCIDKSGFVDEVLDGLGSVANSFVPPTSEWHYSYGTDPEDSPIPFDPAQARSELMDAGWSYDSEGEPAISTTVPLCRAGGADPLEFRFATYDFAAEYVEGALIVEDNCYDAGIKLNLEIHSASQMMTLWVAGDYDLALLDWAFYPLGDPSADTLSLMTSMAIGVYSDTYYSNATFDSLYNDSIAEMPFETRAPIVDEMQRMVYEDASSQPVAYRHSLYAATERYWTGYGNWSENYMLLPDLCLPWLYMRISPVANMAPVVEVDTGFYGITGTPVSVSASVGDDSSPLEYKWFWGDGSSTDWLSGTSGIADHTYVEEGGYVVYVAARENGGDGFITWNRTNILIQEKLNYPPYPDPAYEDTPITYEPAYPDTADSVIFASHFVDGEGDELTYLWDFDDGETAPSDEVEHVYSNPGTYTVSLSVTDNQEGPGERPTSASITVDVVLNDQPTIELTGPSKVLRDCPATFTAGASDDDALRFTWDWGDDSISVTYVDSSSHIYIEEGVYVLTVYADDLTGLPGHNVSDTSEINVLSEANPNVGPYLEGMSWDPDRVYTGEETAWAILASDQEQGPDGEGLLFTWDWDDGTYTTTLYKPVTNDTLVEDVQTHTWNVPGIYCVKVSVWDGFDEETNQDHNVSAIIEGDFVVLMNQVPSIIMATNISGLQNQEVTCEAIASDPDPDILTFTWDWGDGTYSVVAIDTSANCGAEVRSSVGHTWDATGIYEVIIWVDDGRGHNMSQTATATILSPVTQVPPSSITVSQNPNPGVINTPVILTVGASDANEDALTVTFDFGDGDESETMETSGGTSSMQYVEFSHVYVAEGAYHITVYVNDGTANVSMSRDVLVVANEPPSLVLSETYFFYANQPKEIEPLVIRDPDGDLLTVWYDWGDETPLTMGDPDAEYCGSHIYTEAGDYVLTVYADDGKDNVSATADVEVQNVNTPPVASFEALPSIGGVGQKLSFDASSSYDEEDMSAYLVVRWDWEDDGVWDTVWSTDKIEQHQYTEESEYTIRLEVMDTGLLADTATRPVIIDGTAPIADAGLDQNVAEDTIVELDGSSSSDNIGIANYSWSYVEVIDGNEVETYLMGEHATTIYENPGDYVVTLMVVDFTGLWDTDNVTIRITDVTPPIADAGLNQTVDEDTLVTFDGGASSDNVGVVDLIWTFADGAVRTLYGVNPNYTFETPGTYPVMLNVSDAAGNYAMDTVIITVLETNEPPVADAGANQTVTVGDVVTFNGFDSSDDTQIENYTWTFAYDDEARELYGVSPTFVFDIAGTYIVTLTVEDAEGETDTDTVTVIVEKRSFAESYGLLFGIVIALAIVALVSLFILKGRKGGATLSGTEREKTADTEP